MLALSPSHDVHATPSVAVSVRLTRTLSPGSHRREPFPPARSPTPWPAAPAMHFTHTHTRARSRTDVCASMYVHIKRAMMHLSVIAAASLAEKPRRDGHIGRYRTICVAAAIYVHLAIFFFFWGDTKINVHV